jgi:anti-anti-sigma regulatory factor
MSAISAEPEKGDGLITVTRLADCIRLRLTGEVDILNHDQLRSALTALRTDCIAAVHLELAGLRFIDVTGTRELMAFAQSHPCLRLILHDPPASLRRIITLLWPGTNVEIRVSSP